MERAWLRPIVLALAAAVLICAVPLAYRIANCANFDAGFSLQQLFSFKCQTTSVATDGGFSAAANRPEFSNEARAANQLTLPQGYVAYRVDGGIARAAASLAPASGGVAPPFSKVAVGAMLRATAHKQIRQRPFSTSTGVTMDSGTCFKVIEGDRIEDEEPTGSRSGGWLPVQAVARCP